MDSREAVLRVATVDASRTLVGAWVLCHIACANPAVGGGVVINSLMAACGGLTFCPATDFAQIIFLTPMRAVRLFLGRRRMKVALPDHAFRVSLDELAAKAWLDVTSSLKAKTVLCITSVFARLATMAESRGCDHHEARANKAMGISIRVVDFINGLLASWIEIALGPAFAPG